MVRTQVYQLGERRQRDFFGKTLVDILGQLLLLPLGKAAANRRCGRQNALVHAHELVRECDAERFDIGILASIRMRYLRLEFGDGVPEIAVEKEQPWAKLNVAKAKIGLQQRAARVDVEVSAARQGTRLLPAKEPASRGNEGHLAAPWAEVRPRQPVDERLAVVAIDAFGCDQQVTRRGEFVAERLMPNHLGGLDLYGAPRRAPTLQGRRRGKRNDRMVGRRDGKATRDRICHPAAA